MLRRLGRKLLYRYACLEYDGLNLYRPLPSATAFQAALSDPSLHVALAIGSNQAGKTLTLAAEQARIARGLHPRFPDPGIMLLVGASEDHIADVMWKKLSGDGAYDIVPDEVTGAWRTVRLNPANPREIDPIDESRKHLWRQAPPLLPATAIKKIAWRDKARGIPGKVEMHSGWTLLFHSSGADIRRGIQIRVAFFDEEILNAAWFNETLPRLLRHNGVFIWGCTPQSSTIQLLDLHERAMAGVPGYHEIHLSIDDNPYLSADAKQKFFNSLLTDEERQVRYYGQFAILGRRVYGEFNTAVHCVNSFPIPDDWMRVAFMDPGSQCNYTLLAAVPPDADEIHCYSEIVVRNGTARDWALSLKKHTDKHRFEFFEIDYRGGRQTAMGLDVNTVEVYGRELRELGITSATTGSGFRWSSDNTQGREMALRTLMRPREGKSPILRIHGNQCPLLVKQLPNQFYNKRTPNKRDKGPAHDAVDCIEYMAAAFANGPYYVSPQKIESVQEKGVYDAFLEYTRKQSAHAARRS